MNLMYYVRILIRRGWILALAVIVTAAAAFGFSKLQTPTYRATQVVLFQPARSDYGLTETLRTLLASNVVWMNSDERAQDVINRLQLDMMPGELRSHAIFASDPTKLTVQIDVTMEDGPLAAQVATEYGTLLEEYRTEENRDAQREDRIDAMKIDTATYGQYSPKTKINVIAGAVLGLLLGGVIVFVLEYLDSNIVRRREDVERFLDLPVLAAVPAEDSRS
ncbi:MAG TPA: Wzz/FepE/Etk N-terminal domain-containing protein [Aggregatilinea sp.]|uniref:YveK family protein n=1 Tax=Aggregatilinea sp. TaxID=2806333 RepID=UPI002BCF02B1|nr:Wzz/FepE/Etk N-terminal domain-containing protein [Aggregatilinea sp.]HML20432.1 Wzz/FepE/Etk N-terminal domain-containing protein [Aggregatilinea sp.]